MRIALHDSIRAEWSGDALRCRRALRLAGADHTLNIGPHEPLSLTSDVRTRREGGPVSRRIPALSVFCQFLGRRDPVECGGVHPLSKDTHHYERCTAGGEPHEIEKHRVYQTMMRNGHDYTLA